ncbi:MAG: glutamate racemase, partial [Ruminococcus sp.]|nr:glutamate racemase [Candidatus Copronaster equi]
MIINQKSIGVFDSGIGGLTVVKKINELMPEENIIYIGDTANVPYGTKSPEEIKKLVFGLVDKLLSFDVKAIVIACNTADSIVGDILRNECKVPVFGVVEPAANEAVRISRNKKIGLIATNAAVNNGTYQNTIKALDNQAEVFAVACPLLVPFAEAGRFEKEDTEVKEALKSYLLPLKEKNIDTLILGCTHYPLFEDMIKEILPEINIVSSSDTAAKKLKDNLYEISDKPISDNKIYVTKNPSEVKEKAKIFMEDIN